MSIDKYLSTYWVENLIIYYTNCFFFLSVYLFSVFNIVLKGKKI